MKQLLFVVLMTLCIVALSSVAAQETQNSVVRELKKRRVVKVKSEKVKKLKKP
jgi:hypothetical protein